MKHMNWIAAGALVLAGCGQAQESAENNAQAAPAAQTYSGAGKVTAIAGNQVTIAHGPIQGIGWPAMTMTFTAPDGMATDVATGNEVSFSFRQADGAYTLTLLQKR